MSLRATHLFFDFFGTLVSTRVLLHYPQTQAVLQDHGASAEPFLPAWDAVYNEYENRANAGLGEFSMEAICEDFLTRSLPRPPQPAATQQFLQAFLQEWSMGIEYLPGLPEMLDQLAGRYTLGLISNTHYPPLVRHHLAAAGLERFFPAPVLSVTFGRRKPAPEIFAHALQQAGASAGQSIYIGDSYFADYGGAKQAGMQPLLIDPEQRHPIQAEERLMHLLELPEKLATRS